jgi:hypothetical protein
MFEQEIEMEQKESSILPLLLMIGLAGVIVGSVVYWVFQARKTLPPEQATIALTHILNKQGPVTLIFRTGNVEPSINEKPRDPHYKLMEKAGLIKTAAVKGKDLVNVTLTPDGEQVMATLPELRKREDKDGTTVYFVPIASKKIVAVTKVTMSGPNLARVEYTWQWNPTAVGEIFDTNSKYVKTFNIWDTQTLISKYDVNYYHGEPAKAAINMVRGENDQWKPSAE